MSANETVHTSATGGQKAGNDERYDLIPAEPLRRLAIHAGTRIINGKPGSFARMMDHAWLFWAGEEDDYACDWPHLIAAAWEAFNIVDPKAPHGVWHGNDGEARYDRIPGDALRQLARHFGVGAKKYDDDNWTRGYDWRLTFAAANRHAEQFRSGESHDPETGSHHLISFAWHMLVLDEFTRINRDGDTRYATKVRAWLDAEAEHRANTAPSPFTGPMDDTTAAFVVSPAPGVSVRVIEERGLEGTERNAQWTDTDGTTWRWNHEMGNPDNGAWEYFTDLAIGGWAHDARPTAMYAPYTEVIAPRVVESLGDTERDAEWDGPCGRYRYDTTYERWTRRPEGWAADPFPTILTTTGYGPFTEHTKTGDDE